MSEPKTQDLIEEVAKKNPIYDDFVRATPYIGEVVPTKAHSKKRGYVDSERSLSFKMEEGDDVYATLKKRFGIQDAKAFSNSYAEAVSGDGKEERRMLTLHSSALCSLLHFYRPEGLYINLGDGKVMKVDGSRFEYKNPVFLGHKGECLGHPSNIDVVLYGKILKDNKDCLLFLESKYSEYMQASTNSYSDKYESLINDYFGSLAVFKTRSDGNNISLFIEDGRDHFYDGIKQMAAHLKGITNFMSGERYEPQIGNRFIETGAKEIYFGEIAYEHEGRAFDQWEKDYGVLAGVYNLSRNKNPSEPHPAMVPGLITYQELFGEDSDNVQSLEPEIAIFYGEATMSNSVGPFVFNKGRIGFQRELVSDAYEGGPIVKGSFSLEKLRENLHEPSGLYPGGEVAYDLIGHRSVITIDKAIIGDVDARESVIREFGIFRKHYVFIRK